MFYFTYLRRELGRRVRQSIFIGLGLAIGIGLVITVMGASAGVKTAQDKVLASLYGIGTDLTVAETPQPPGVGSGEGSRIVPGPGGTELCVDNICHKVTGNVVDQLDSAIYGTFSATAVAKIAGLRDVVATVGGLYLADDRTQLATAGSSSLPLPASFSVYGTDVRHLGLGPISETRLASGRGFTSADADSDVALVDSSYATGDKLKTGGTVKVGGVTFKVIGIVEQPGSSSPPDVYIPLARAQAIAISMATGEPLSADVNTVYVTAASASDITAVQQEIQRLLPPATVTSQASLGSEITGSLTSAAKIVNEFGKWLAIMVLIAAFAVASLLTLAAVSRRVREFGTLKAIGWPSRRIVSQVLGESLVTGIGGGIAGTALGIAGIAIINAVAVPVSAVLPSVTGATPPTVVLSQPGRPSHLVSESQTVVVPLSVSVTADAIVLAIVLAVAGGLLAGLFGAWRAARLRPAAALTTVA